MVRDRERLVADGSHVSVPIAQLAALEYRSHGPSQRHAGLERGRVFAMRRVNGRFPAVSE